MSQSFSKSDVITSMRRESIMSIALNSPRGPISSMVLFAIDEDFTIYFATHEDTFKSKAILEDNRISFSVWEKNVMLVQAKGVATPIEDIYHKDISLEKIVHAVDNIDSFWPPVLRIRNDSEYVVYKIKPDWVRALDLTSKTITALVDPFVEIEV